MTSQKTLFSIEEKDNQIYAVRRRSQPVWRHVAKVHSAAAGLPPGRRALCDSREGLQGPGVRRAHQDTSADPDHRVRSHHRAQFLTQTVHRKSSKTTGHSNRVYAARYLPDDHNVLLTGGWDNTVQVLCAHLASLTLCAPQVWDVRAGHSVRSIYGPHICGKAVRPLRC